MKKIQLLFAIAVLSIIFSCQEKEAKTKVEDSGNTVESSSTPSSTNISQSDLKPLPADLFKPVYLEADYMDIIFEELPFSMSQDNNNSIRQILNYIDVNAPDSYDPNCPLFGQLLVQKEAVYVMEANIYHSGGCYYWLIKQQGNQYLNAMTDAGIEFFNQLKQRKF
jgi:hypothetical protein